MTFNFALEGYVNGLDTKEEILYISASQRQSERILRDIRLFTQFDNLELPVDSVDHIVLPSGTEIWALPCTSDTTRGLSPKRLYIDELAHYKRDRAVMQAIAPMISRKDKLRYLTVSSTPLGKRGAFYDIMQTENNGFSKHTIDIYKAIQGGCPIDVDTCKLLVPNDIAFAQEYLCQFMDEMLCYFPVDLINSCRDDALEMYSEETLRTCTSLFAGYDAGKLVDSGVFYILEPTSNGFVTRHIREWQGEDYSKQLEYIERVCRNSNITKLMIDSTGVGIKLLEDLTAKLGSQVEGVTFTNSSKEYMINNLRSMFQDRKIKIPYDRKLVIQLHSLQREITGAGSIRYRHEQGGHDDYVWALALACSGSRASNIAGHFEDDVADSKDIDSALKPLYDNSVTF